MLKNGDQNLINLQNSSDVEDIDFETVDNYKL